MLIIFGEANNVTNSIAILNVSECFSILTIIHSINLCILQQIRAELLEQLHIWLEVRGPELVQMPLVRQAFDVVQGSAHHFQRLVMHQR